MKALKMKMNKILEIICITLFAFITILGTYQIVTRYVFNSPSSVSQELLTFSFTWLALLAASLVFGKREHMRIEYVANFFKGRQAEALNIISEVLVLTFSLVVLVYGGSQITKLTIHQVTASLGIPMAYVYVVLPISGVITTIYSIINISEFLSNKNNGEIK